MKLVENGPLTNLTQIERPAVLIRTGGGRAPSYMALRTLERMNRIRAWQGLPLVDGIFPINNPSQINLLRSEAKDPSRILIDTTYAGIVNPFLSSHGDFLQHVDVINSQWDTTREQLDARFGTNAVPFQAISQSEENSVVSHLSEDLIGVLDVGSRFPHINIEHLDHSNHYFLFPVLASELWRFAQTQQSYDPTTRLNINAAIEKMRKLEEQYKIIYLSRINTLSSRYPSLSTQPKSHLGRPVVYTPPMSPNITTEVPIDDIERPSAFVMFSGTGSAIEETNRLIPRIQEAGYDVYVANTRDLTGKNEGSVHVASSPRVIYNASTQFAIGRLGMGIFWDCFEAGIPLFSPPLVSGDDPEIQENVITMGSLGLGGELRSDEDISPQQFRQKIRETHFAVQRMREGDLSRYGTLDGLGWIGSRIANDIFGIDQRMVAMPDGRRIQVRPDPFVIHPLQ